MIRCGACHGVIGSAEDPHWFGGDLRYHPGCCPACTTPDAGVGHPITEPPAVERMKRMKRGHRRGTPRAWALRGAGG